MNKDPFQKNINSFCSDFKYNKTYTIFYRNVLLLLKNQNDLIAVRTFFSCSCYLLQNKQLIKDV